MNTVTRYFNRKCQECPGEHIYAQFERGSTKNRLSPFKCCDCDAVWVPKQTSKYYHHIESDCVFEVTTTEEETNALNHGCVPCSKRFAELFDLGLADDLPLDYED